MNLNDYISTGKLELYVLGKLDHEEQLEVERMAKEHPAIKEEIESIEVALEKYALLNATEPPEGVLEKLLEQIRTDQDPPAPSAQPDPRTPGGSGPSFTPVWTVLLAAAAMAAGWFWTQQRQLGDELDNLQEAFDVQALNCDEQEEIMNIMAEQINFLRSPASRQIILNSANETLAPNALASVFYNPESRQSYFIPSELPAAPTGRQYQLWAIVDGAPVDMGVLAFQGGSKELIEVPFIENPGAFAITLEPEGGSTVPSLDQLYVIGNVT